MSTDDIWNSFLKKIKSKVSLMSFNYIFKDLKLHSYSNSKAIIIVPTNELLLQNITKNYHNIIEEVFNDITNDTCDIEYVFEKDIPLIKKNDDIQIIDDNKENVIDDDLSNYKYNSHFNPKFTFDTFVVGESNKLAFGTAQAVAKNPGKLYNPYFIYSKSGLGKTHLMHAIGNYIVTHSDKKVLYITAEQFKNDFTSIINSKSSKDNNISYLEAFREKYRNVDVLMIDDIQFLENKEKTQIEFTNTFNTLYDNEKQIIIASDKSINDYQYLEERLKTRFRWGLTESINPPEFELRKNIIKNKIMLYYKGLNISEEIIDYMANNCGSDVRNIEGAVTRLFSYTAMFHDSELTLAEATIALKEYVEKPIGRTNSISKILSEVAKFYNLDVMMLKGKMKKKNVANARAVAMYLIRLLSNENLQQIGLELGGRDHSTVIYNCEKISEELKTNIQLQEEIKLIKEKLRE